MTRPQPRRAHLRHAQACALVCAASALAGCAGAGPEIQSLSSVAIPDATAPAQLPRLDVRWRAELIDFEPWVWRPLEYSQPAVSPDGELVVVGTSHGEVVAVDTLTGQVRWSAPTGARVDARPIFFEDLVLVGNDEGTFLALSLTSGQERWRYRTRSEIDGAATVAEGRVLFQNGADELYALDATTGKYLWSFGRELPDYFTLGNPTVPLVAEGVVYTGFADGVLVALRLDDGGEVWEADLTNGERDFTDIDGQPALADGVLYASSHAGGLFALEAATGKRLWRLEVTGAIDPVVVGQTLYTTTAGRHVMAIDRQRGRVLWQYRHNTNTPSGLTRLADYISYGGSEAGFFITDRTSGYPLVHFDPDAGFSSPVTFNGTDLYAFSNRGFLYRFELVAR